MKLKMSEKLSLRSRLKSCMTTCLVNDSSSSTCGHLKLSHDGNKALFYKGFFEEKLQKKNLDSSMEKVGLFSF